MKKMKEIVYNENLHFEHENWKSELAFWEDELKSFTNRLSELVTRWTNDEALNEMEYFYKEFVFHGAVIDEFNEVVQAHEASMAHHSVEGNGSLDVVLAKKHDAFRIKMEKQRQIYTDLKRDFFRFLSKYM